MKSEIDKQQSDMCVMHYDMHGNIRWLFDFRLLQVSDVVTAGLKMAFEASLGHCILETKRHAWRHVKLFCSFLQEADIAKDVPLPSETLIRFREWLTPRDVSDKYKSSILNVVISLVLWCARNCDGVVDRRLRVDSVRLPRLREKEMTSEKRLGEPEIKAILAAAYSEIDAVVERITDMRRELDELAHHREGSNLARLILELQSLSDGLFVSNAILLKQKRSLQNRVHSSGGLNNLSRCLYPCAEDVFPFYLAILCQCSANPMSMRILMRESVVKHPLRSDRRRIVWGKKRSGYEQKADFNTKRSRSAPNLIDILLQLTEPLVPFADPQDRKMVFLSYRRCQVSVPSWQTLHNLLDQFIARHNLPSFEFKDLRRAGAELHEKAAGSILAAKSRLNHRSSRTTQGYVSGQALRESLDKTIAESQDTLVAKVTESAIQGTHGIETRLTRNEAAETVFGFICKDPWAGTATGTTAGKLCTKFTACASCPGAIIPLDDPFIVSKLVKSAEQLKNTHKRAIEHGWLERFKAFYEPTQRILEHELLPRVSKEIMQRALSLLDSHNVPYLE